MYIFFSLYSSVENIVFKEYYKLYTPLMSRCNKILKKEKKIQVHTYVICTMSVNLIFWEYVFKFIVIDTDANCH